MRLFIDNIVCFAKNSAEHVCDLESFFGKLSTFDSKLAPEEAFFGARTFKFFGPSCPAKGNRARSK